MPAVRGEVSGRGAGWRICAIIFQKAPLELYMPRVLRQMFGWVLVFTGDMEVLASVEQTRIQPVY